MTRETASDRIKELPKGGREYKITERTLKIEQHLCKINKPLKFKSGTQALSKKVE